MDKNRHKFIWITDLHLNNLFPWTLNKYLNHLRDQKPDGVFITGDISSGFYLIKHLKMLAETLSCPIYFVLGNHCLYGTSIAKQHQNVRDLCKQYPNLIWMREAGVIGLNKEVALIGSEGWYDAENGKPEYLQLTFDWFMIDDFRKLNSMEERIETWRKLADESVEDLVEKLEKAIDQGYKNVYLLSHIPAWAEATRDVGTLLEPFWLPYNTNMRLGRALEKVMYDHKKRHLTCYFGHTHSPLTVQVSRNIECRVGKGAYYKITNEEVLYI